MHPEQEPVARAAGLLTERFGEAPPTGLVLGSGLGGLVERLTHVSRASFESVGLPQSSVAGHAGEVVRGRLGAAEVVMLSGRVHIYEGWTPDEVVRYVRALHRWGLRQLLLTNSVGGISDGFDPGTMVVVTDHLNLQGTNPLVGLPFGERFPDLTTAYDPELRRILTDASRVTGFPLLQGVLAAMLGPSYETPAEVRMLKTLGADVVGMSTVPEVVAAAGIGLRCAVLAMVSNRAAGLGDHALSHAEVTETAIEAGDRLAATLIEAIGRL